MISDRFSGELQELVHHQVLDQLAGADDSDTVRAKIVLEQWIAEIRGYNRPRPTLIAALEAMIAAEFTAGELRARCRNALAELAQGAR